jgi:hypothetical protein
MGLDQYAKWTQGETETEFKYWRKTNHIQNWFQKLYAEKTGDTNPENFNCVKVEIDFEVLQRFITDVKENKMQCTEGFFFGYMYDTNDPEVVEDDLKFASNCFFHLLMDRKVFYSSWW